MCSRLDEALFQGASLFLLMTNAEKRYLTKIDEINQLFYKVADTYGSVDALNQAVHDFLTDMYLEGYAATGYLLKDKERSADYELIEELLLLNIDGKTLYDRIDEYYNIAVEEKRIGKTDKTAQTEQTIAEQTPAKVTKAPKIDPENAVTRVLETESHRMYNSGGFDRATVCKAKYKSWVTMADEKVRDSHSYIEGEKIGINDKFYTYDGDSALMPGGFELAENNVNCRCWLSYSF